MRRIGRRSSAVNDDFEVFFEVESDSLQRFATFMCGDADLAAELAQEALTRAFTAWHRIDAADARAYVRRIVVNAARDKHRHDLVRRRRPMATLVERSESSEHDAVERMTMVEALSTLSPVRRAVVVLRFYEDLPEQQIADLLERPAGSVRSDLHRALKTLRNHLGATEHAGGRDGS